MACMMMLTINVFYFGVSLYQQLRALSQPESPQAPPLPAEAERVQQVDPAPLSETEVAEATMPADLPEEKQYSKVIIVHTSKRSIPIPVSDICYIYTREGMVLLRTFDMESMGDSHQLDRKLKDYEDMLDPELFFRINRQLIVHIRAVKDYHPFSPKTPELTLDPARYTLKEPVPDSHKRLPVVAEDRVPPFRTWISR